MGATHHVGYAYTVNGHHLKTPTKQSGGTCYAHACASAIRATESRIVGRNPQSHESLVREITNKYGCDGGHVTIV
eukprot:CAMPEP_0201577292 /NCGR_PEP_ID=MMETSP0190_2-20130828/23585_1 /ASSEMBLY_ACC=CAM_ASM_000263 /TAXON_ID=37353 /ORGANISM="Rosalina sp." /LENGTH=74 /DNA_ID=CAMNT_0048009139 /DNA_START=35 /DNA_END=256 /DNA_ORIENTATION=+